MKKILTVITFSALLLGGCSAETMPVPNISPETTTAAEEHEVIVTKAYTPLNYDYQQGEWIPYFDYENYLQGKTEDEFRQAIRKRFTNAKENGINTVYLHIHPSGDAYYHSQLYPKGTFWDGEYDPLEIMLDEAHKLGLSAHGWLNPLRLQYTDEFENIPDSYITKQWFNTPESPNIGEVSGRMYLKPDSPEVITLITDTVAEIIENYDVDGIHIDDYFYPTVSPDFDSREFASSGENDLAKWRTDNISRLVQAIYRTVKNADERLIFGISPQGNINADYNSQYADVKRWLAESGFCDYMIPQLYYGFAHETLPFQAALEQWESLPKAEDVRLIIGLGAYKLGKNDAWAGASAETEWIDDPDIISKQINAVKKSTASGYALFY